MDLMDGECFEGFVRKEGEKEKKNVAVRQKLYYRALVPQIIWQLRFPYQTFIDSRQIEFMGKTRTRTN